MNGSRTRIALLAAALVVASTPVRAAMESQGDTSWDGKEPPQGIYFHWYEPSFYAGFAPRTQDPSRPHIELSRGNQLRVTVPLGDAELDTYLEDLVARRKVYQELIDAGVIRLSTNSEYERFAKALDEKGVADLVAQKAALGAEAYRERSVEVMSALNGGRVFRVALPFDALLADWHPKLAGALGSNDAKLELVNALVPGRIELYELDPDVDAALSKAAAAAGGGPSDPAFRAAAEELVRVATDGHYRVEDGRVRAIEFTAIYPAGTIEGYTSYKGERMGDFGVTGVWPLIRRTTGRGMTGMVEYLSPNPGYGFITMLPYQFAGGIAYNAFHNAGVRAQLNSTPFLPSQWRRVPGERDPGKSYQNLWIASRGPTSHGCTRLGSGHMSELAQIIPTSSDALTKLPTYRNEPYCYDVFDIDGDGRGEVMGVQYYLAYRSTADRIPIATYAKNEREPFYRWLYGSNVKLGPIGKTTLTDVPTCRFRMRDASEAETLRDVPLYEAAWTPETIQFYTIRGAAPDSNPGFELNREIRKVGHGHATDRKKLRLD